MPLSLKNPVVLILLNAIILVGVFSLLAKSLVVVQRVATVQMVAGRATLWRGGTPSVLWPRQARPLRAGDVLSTGRTSVADVLWADGTRLRLNPSSQITVQRALYNAALRAEDTHLTLGAGSLFLRVLHDHARYGHFTVKTPQLLADFQQGVYAASAVGRGPAVENFRGAVSVTRTNCSTGRTVAPGTLLRADSTSCGVTTGPLDASVFQVQPSVSMAPVEVNVQPDKATSGFLRVASESGARLAVDGKKIVTKIPGEWSVPVTLNPGLNRWSIACTDMFGVVHQVEESFVVQKVAPPAVAPASR